MNGLIILLKKLLAFFICWKAPGPQRNIMPGLPPRQRRNYFTRKKMLDWELISIIAYQIFFLHRALSVRVVERRYFEAKKTYIPYKDFGYADLICYLHSVKGLSVTVNSTNGQYQVVADEDEELFNMHHMFFFPNEEDANV